ncbi:MAG: type I methionyl aminopeptidase [Actinomycetaceae bacterium]|nr:type I methionyl aminopeptidase [Actinomycetaceae bacterium]
MLYCQESALIVNEIHNALRESVHVGMTTAEADDIARDVLVSAGARSNFLGYYEYPAHICVSVNEEIVHGIPGERVIQSGDIVSFDCGAVKNGWHGDSCFTMVMPGGDEAIAKSRQRLSDMTEESMWAGIAAIANGAYIGDIGGAIDDFVTENSPDLDIVLDYIGHGIGSQMHQGPDVPNYRTRARGPKIRSGMILCVEPMLTSGSQDNVTLDDGWTVVTLDGKDACHWECQVAVHDRGIWVLNKPDGGAQRLEKYGVTPLPL